MEQQEAKRAKRLEEARRNLEARRDLERLQNARTDDSMVNRISRLASSSAKLPELKAENLANPDMFRMWIWTTLVRAYKKEL
mmetsp:Transcript_31089/g.96207  ORF Transcript_31089/g.96207 Transcript_31089/m.96207 type:complete len:82 (+) Transcript_31089:1029-1274(+)